MQLVQYLYAKDDAVNWIDSFGLATFAEYNNILGKIRKVFNSNDFLGDVYEVVKVSNSECNMMFHVFTQIYVAHEIINKEVILADHRKIKEVLYNEKDLLSILDTAYDFSSICACGCCKQ